MTRKLCYRHHVTEFGALPNGRRWEAASWVTVNEDHCEMCHPEPDEKTHDALKKAYEALVQVEMIEHTNWIRHTPGFDDKTVHFVEACAWCHTEGGHSDNCPRQAALAAIEELEL